MAYSELTRNYLESVNDLVYDRGQHCVRTQGEDKARMSQGQQQDETLNGILIRFYSRIAKKVPYVLAINGAVFEELYRQVISPEEIDRCFEILKDTQSHGGVYHLAALTLLGQAQLSAESRPAGVKILLEYLNSVASPVRWRSTAAKSLGQMAADVRLTDTAM